MAFVPNSSMKNNAPELRSPANEFQGDQSPIMGQSGSEINNQSAINQPELATACNYVEADTAALTSNQLPNPSSPEDIPVFEDAYRIPHQKLALQLSQPSQQSTPMFDSYIHKPVTRVKSITTPGGRVVRNISMNNSVKYDISTAFNKYSTSFSGYNNHFRTSSVNEDGQQRQQRPSLRRDGQARRNSRHQRTDSGRSMSVSSSEDNFVDKSGGSPTFTHQMSTDSCTSVTSNTQLVKNPYNTVNQKIYSAILCPCVFFFCFVCSFPAVQFMRRSDRFFDENNYNKARIYARLSTALFILGIVLSLAFVSAIFAVIILFTI